MFAPDDTIVALATPPGRGGLAVVRLSGPLAVGVSSTLVMGDVTLEPRRATLVRLSGGREGGAIDEGVATFFARPGSFTGEDVVEFSVHGSPAIVEALVTAAVAGGARIAKPGEFTLRAFLNGRLDLTRAEAVADLVDATTVVQARTAFDQLQGGLAERIGAIEGRLFDVMARLEASGDFPEEGYHFITAEETRAVLEEELGKVEGLLRDGQRGRLVREGVTVAIVGRPNVGKSTLFNRLAGVERAIVTAIPGTTRDLLTEVVSLHGTRLTLVDTAGVRASADIVEREGIERAERAGRSADVVVVLLDASEALTAEDVRVIGNAEGSTRVIALNKCDLAEAPMFESEVRQVASVADAEELTRLCAKSGCGVERLAERIARVVGVGEMTECARVSNARHLGLLGQTAESLRRAVGLPGREFGHMPEEIVLSDLRAAIESLQEVTGERNSDDLLDAIFSRFCIGK